MARGKSTPWGMSQHESEKAPGIVFHSTAGHGGFHLSPDRQKALQKKFAFSTFAGGPWYEEDCDAAAVAIAFPEFFSANSIRGAVQAVRHFVQHNYGDKWKEVLKYIEASPEMLAVERGEVERTKELWERQGLFCGVFNDEYAGHWAVNFTRGDERKTLMLPAYPEQQWYTDQELSAFEAHDPAKHNKPPKQRKVLQAAFTAGGDETQSDGRNAYSDDLDCRSDADPGL